MKYLLLFCVLSLNACKADASSVTPEFRSACNPPASFEPSYIQRQPPAGSDTHLACCDGPDYCVWVDTFAECNFPNIVYYCEWGQCNPDGTVTCYDAAVQ